MATLTGAIAPVGNISTPAIITSAGTALAANINRCGLIIQNLGQNPLYVRFGGTASATVFHVALSAGTADDNGEGGSLILTAGVIPTGLVSIAGTSPRAVVNELLQ